MRYIETWLTGLGLDYIIPKLKAQGITTPKKLAALSLRDIYEVVGVEDTEDRKKLFFLIRRLKSILKSKGGDDDEEEEEEELAEEPKDDTPTVPQSVNNRSREEYAESRLTEEHEIFPTTSRASPVDKAPSTGTIPDTAESQEDLRRLRLNHRRQALASSAPANAPATTTTATSTVEKELESSETAKGPATRGIRATRSSLLNSGANTVSADSVSTEKDVNRKQAQDKEVNEKPSLIAPPPSRISRQSNRQQPLPQLSTSQSSPEESNYESSPFSMSVTPPPVAAPPATEMSHSNQYSHDICPSNCLETSAHNNNRSKSSSFRPQTAPPPANNNQSNYEIHNSHHLHQKANIVAQSLDVKPQFTSDDEQLNNNGADMTSATLRVVVRKRPLGPHELHRGERDILEVGDSGALVVRDIKTKVDLTKYWQRIPFQFDDAFAEYDSNRTIYDNCLRSLLPNVLSEGMKVSCFTYGQTGSGKTYTMFGAGENASFVADEGDRFGLYHLCMADVLHMIEQSKVLHSSLRVYLTCFEIYGEKLFDLLNNRNLVKNLEDAKQHVRIVGLTEHEVSDLDTFQRLLQTIVACRSTSSTGANHDSSRSHQVLEVSFKYYNPALAAAQAANHGSISRRAKPAAIPPAQLPAAVMGKIVFVDLAGSEKAADTFMNAKNTRMEGADINTSLLALKEVFRSMEKKNGYMPFRGSKLTQVLKESLQGKSVRTCMIACVSPASSHYEQTMNTLRYAAKVYEVTAGTGAAGGTEVEEAPYVNLQDDPRIVYTAADHHEMQAAADVLAHHSSKHSSTNSNQRAASAPRGGASSSSAASNTNASRSRSGSQSATANANTNATNSNNSGNRRISTGAAGLPKPTPSSAGSHAVSEASKLPLGRLLSSAQTSEDEQPHPSNAFSHYNQGNSNNTSYYTAEDEANYSDAHLRRPVSVLANGTHVPSSSTATTTHSKLRPPTTSYVALNANAINNGNANQGAKDNQTTADRLLQKQQQSAQPTTASSLRRNSFAGHTKGKIPLPAASNNGNAQVGGQQLAPASPGPSVQRSAMPTTSQSSSAAAAAGSSSSSGLPRPHSHSFGLNANKPPPPSSSSTTSSSAGANASTSVGSLQQSHAAAAVASSSSSSSAARRTLPDYPESSDAYEGDEEDDSHRHRHQPARTKDTATSNTTTSQKHKQVYHVEPIEHRYYASQAHLTAESYIADPDHAGERDDDDDDEIIIQEEDDDGDEGEAGDDEQELKYRQHDHSNHSLYSEDEDNVAAQEYRNMRELPGQGHDLAAAAKTEELQMTWGLLSAHKLSIAEMVEVMKEEMELVQRMENVDERDTDEYLETLQAILTAKSIAVTNLRQELKDFQEFRTEQRLYR